MFNSLRNFFRGAAENRKITTHEKILEIKGLFAWHIKVPRSMGIGSFTIKTARISGGNRSRKYQTMETFF